MFKLSISDLVRISSCKFVHKSRILGFVRQLFRFNFSGNRAKFRSNYLLLRVRRCVSRAKVVTTGVHSSPATPIFSIFRS